MSHTTEVVLQSEEFALKLPDPITAFEGPVQFPGQLHGDWREIALTTPFEVNGEDNLVVEISGTPTSEETTTGCLIASDNLALTTGRSLNSYSDAEAPTGTLSSGPTDMLFDVERYSAPPGCRIALTAEPDRAARPSAQSVLT